MLKSSLRTFLLLYTSLSTSFWCEYFAYRVVNAKFKLLKRDVAYRLTCTCFCLCRRQCLSVFRQTLFRTSAKQN